MMCLMRRNVATAGWEIQDALGRSSKPGCIIASPSYPADEPGTDQDYVHHWTRDAAIVAMEFVASGIAPLVQDFVSFAKTNQDATRAQGKPFDWAAFYVNGDPREGWNAQSDGPALQSLTIVRGWSLLSAATRSTAATVVSANVDFLVAHGDEPTKNLWEETNGHSFFARAVQVQCFSECLANAGALQLSAAQQSEMTAAKAELVTHLQDHWSNGDQRYRSISDAPRERGWDLNADVVMASVYGAIPCTDERLLSTAAQVHAAFADPGSPWFYKVNGQDAAIGMGPMLGRYPMDTYDGNVGDGETPGGHPWAPCTCSFAELYYKLAHAHRTGVPIVGGLARPFYDQVGIASGTSTSSAVDLLKAAGDRMLRAIMRHSDHVELSEQFNGNSGFELGVRNLTWSYAAFLSAVRARNQI